MPDAHTWPVCKAVVETMFCIVNQCIFNQTRRYWLLSNDLNVALSISVCMKNHIQQSDITPFNFMKGDFESKLGALRMHIMAKVQVVLIPFLTFTSSYNDSKAHNMLALMLDPRLKSLDVVMGVC